MNSTYMTAEHAVQLLRQLNTKLNCYKYSFLPATIVSWNTLPLEVRELPSLEQSQHASSQITVIGTVSTCVIPNYRHWNSLNMRHPKLPSLEQSQHASSQITVIGTVLTCVIPNYRHWNSLNMRHPKLPSLEQSQHASSQIAVPSHLYR